MIFKISSRYYPVIPLWNHPKSLINDLKTKLDDFSAGLSESIFFVEKGKDPKKRAKAEELTVKMPGFISPETMNEEGYFTQQAKQQLEELKKRGLEKPTLTNPEKKE